MPVIHTQNVFQISSQIGWTYFQTHVDDFESTDSGIRLEQIIRHKMWNLDIKIKGLDRNE